MVRYVLALVSFLCGACGDSDGDQTGEPYGGPSWMQVLGDREGAVTPAEDALVPAACDAELDTSDSEGLIYATWAAENGEDEEFADLDTNQFAARPDLVGEPTPLLAVFAEGQLRRQAAAGYQRTLDIPDPGSLTELVSIDVCSTMRERGSCHVPTDEFAFDGCGSARGEPDSGFLINPALSRLEDVWSLTFTVSAGCDEDTLDSSHPSDIQLGRQTIDLDLGDLADGELREVLFAELSWESSYTSARECDDLVDVTVCRCTWSLSSGTIDIGRAWVLRQGATLYLEIRGAGDDSSLHAWGGFDISG